MCFIKAPKKQSLLWGFFCTYTRYEYFDAGERQLNRMWCGQNNARGTVDPSQRRECKRTIWILKYANKISIFAKYLSIDAMDKKIK